MVKRGVEECQTAIFIFWVKTFVYPIEVDHGLININIYPNNIIT